MPAVRVGSRWLHDAPTEDQVKEWFNAQPLHDGMEHGPYMGGIVLIGSTEKVKVSKQKQNGDTYVAEMERAVHTPYVKVDTRIAYFWDLVRQMNVRRRAHDSDPDAFIGVIEPVPQRVINDRRSPFYNENLPEGFSVMAVKKGEQVTYSFIAQWRVAIYERQSYTQVIAGQRAPAILQGIGSKQTAMLDRYGPDANAIMKAETGAIGRALGVAGVLVVGTGVATAEDMQEAQGPPAGATSPQETALPPVVGAAEDQPGTRIEGPAVEEGQVSGPAVENPPTPQEEDEALRTRARELNGQLQAADKEAHERYLHWYREERGFPALHELSGPALKGAVVKLERELAAVQS